MNPISVEDIVMNLICNGGDCRSKSLEAVHAAKEGDFEAADRLMKEATEAMHAAHHFQTNVIQSEMQEDALKNEVTLLMVHGQDHLMDAMVVNDLAAELIEIYRLLKKS